MLKFNNNELYVDCEWTLDQKIFSKYKITTEYLKEIRLQ